MNHATHHRYGQKSCICIPSLLLSMPNRTHALYISLLTFTPGGKSGNARLISGPMVTHMRNGYMKAAEMGPFYILVREEKASRIPHRHSKVRGHRPARPGYLEVGDKSLAL